MKNINTITTTITNAITCSKCVSFEFLYGTCAATACLLRNRSERREQAHQREESQCL
jgi:hypothetical protein